MFDGWRGDEVRCQVEDLTVPGGVAALVREPEPVMAGPLGEARRALEVARAASDHLVAASEGELSERLAELAELRTRAEQLAVAVTVEAASRGAHLSSDLSLHDWLAQRFPWATRAELADLVLIADELDRPGHAPVRRALSAGTLLARRAARLLRALKQVRAVTDATTYAQDVAVLVPLAQRADVSDAELARVADHLLAVALPEQEMQARERSQRELRGVNESSLADGSLTRFIITADPEGAATLRAVLTSPLAAPAPDSEGPDPRTATQRRYDALLTVIDRGLSSPQGVPTTAKAKVMLTIPMDVLSGQAPGLGQTLTGQTLTAGAARRLACTAELIPAVLGTDSEILDLGRPVRLATPAQLTALYHRDKHCTYPGCTIPPQWCQAHHVIWYSRGGKTYLLNLALLCQRHHTTVHDRNLTATVTPTGVTWHLK